MEKPDLPFPKNPKELFWWALQAELCSASSYGSDTAPIVDWAIKYGLTNAVGAPMWIPDNDAKDEIEYVLRSLQ